MIYTRDDIPYLIGLHFQLNPNLFAKDWIEPEDLETIYKIEGLTIDGDRVKLSWLEDGQKQFTSTEIDDELLRFLNDESWLITDLPEIDTTNIFENEEDEFGWARKATNIYEPKVGDVFDVPGAANTKLRVDEIVWDRNYEPKETIADRGGQWGKIKYIHTGCNIWLERYNESTDSWSTVGTPTDLGWIQYLINIGWWFPVKDSMNEQEDDLQWAKDLVGDMGIGIGIVRVIDSGQQYSSHLEAMAYLGVPEAKERLESVRRECDWNDECLEMRENGILDDAHDGDICYLMPDSYQYIYHLVRVSDKKHFILDGSGFKPYDPNIIKEQEDDFEWAKDIISGPMRLGDLLDNKMLSTGDVVSIEGNIMEGRSLLFTLTGQEFEIMEVNEPGDFINVRLKWLVPRDERPEKWYDATILSIDHRRPYDHIHVDEDTYSDDAKLLITVVRKNHLHIVRESEEDGFEWARELIKQPIMALIVNQVYRVDTVGRMEIMITSLTHEKIQYISKVDISTDPTLDKYQNRLGNTGIDNGERLIKDRYWIPIPIEDSLFSPKYLKESEEDNLEWARNLKPNLKDKWVLIEFMRDMLKEHGYELSFIRHKGIAYWMIRMKSQSGPLYVFPEDKLNPRYIKQRLDQHNDEFPTPESFTWSVPVSREHYYNVYKELERILTPLTE